MNTILSFFGYTPKTEINPEFNTTYDSKMKYTHITDNVITMALDSSEYVTLQEFTTLTDLIPNQSLYDFCQSIYENMPICIDAQLLPNFGFSGTIANQKNQLMDLIRKYKIPYQEVAAPNNKSIIDESDVDSDSDTDISSSNYDTNEFYFLIMPDDFRKLLLCLPNEVGNDVRAHYIKSDHIVRAYMTYQRNYIDKSKTKYAQLEASCKSLQTEIDAARCTELNNHQLFALLNKKIRKLTLKNEALTNNLEELKDEVADTTITKFILVRLNDTDPATYDYYMIYGSTKKANASYHRVRTKYSEAEQICIYKFNIELKLYNLIKSSLGAIVNSEGRYLSPKDTTPRGHTRFVKKIREILDNIS